MIILEKNSENACIYSISSNHQNLIYLGLCINPKSVQNIFHKYKKEINDLIVNG